MAVVRFRHDGTEPGECSDSHGLHKTMETPHGGELYLDFERWLYADEG
jgi:hypothetical protein